MVANPRKIVLFCRSLSRGGAERQIIYLAHGLQKNGHQVTILTLYPPSLDWYDISGLTVVHLGKKSRWDIVGFAKSYIRFLKATQPDVIYSFLTVQNIIAAVTSLFSRSRIICGVRASYIDFNQYSRLDRMLDWLESQLFRLNIKIITNSHAGRDFIIKKTPSAANKISVITNGLDFGTNQFSQAGRQDFRSGLGITDNDILIGHVGRYDPMKDHKTLIKAAAIVTQQVPNCYFLCWGHGDPAYTQALKDYAKSHNVDIIWYSGNSFPCYSAFDLYCLTSIGEGYSNTLTEAMAHGIPCITTDVGDCRDIIGPYGSIIPASSSKDLATAILKKISEKNIIPNHQQINYSRHNFAVEKLITNTEKEFY